MIISPHYFKKNVEFHDFYYKKCKNFKNMFCYIGINKIIKYIVVLK